jgi:hypothetical protein
VAAAKTILARGGESLKVKLGQRTVEEHLKRVEDALDRKDIEL